MTSLKSRDFYGFLATWAKSVEFQQPSKPNRSELHLYLHSCIVCVCMWIQAHDCPQQWWKVGSWGHNEFHFSQTSLAMFNVRYIPKVAKVILLFVEEKYRNKQESSSIRLPKPSQLKRLSWPTLKIPGKSVCPQTCLHANTLKTMDGQQFILINPSHHPHFLLACGTCMPEEGWGNYGSKKWISNFNPPKSGPIHKCRALFLQPNMAFEAKTSGVRFNTVPVDLNLNLMGSSHW